MRPSKFKTIARILDLTELKTAFTLPRKRPHSALISFGCAANIAAQAAPSDANATTPPHKLRRRLHLQTLTPRRPRTSICRHARQHPSPATNSPEAIDGSGLFALVNTTHGLEFQPPLVTILGVVTLVEVGAAKSVMYQRNILARRMTADQMVPAIRNLADQGIVAEPFELVQIKTGRGIYEIRG